MDSRINVREGPVYPQDLSVLLIEDMGREGPMGASELPGYAAAHRILLHYVAKMIALGIHDCIFVGLIVKANDIHELELSCHHNGRIGQDAGGGMIELENAVGIFWYVHGGQQIVILCIRVPQGGRYGYL